VEKCNFCAHRVENEMEPPCATVCPTESIVVGDIDDPASRVSQLIATKQVSVRKPEKGTRPKVFYIEGEPSALTPGIADPSGGYMFADRRGVTTHDYPTARFAPDAGLGAAAPAGAGEATAPSVAAGAPPAEWMGSGLPPAAAAQALAAAALRGDADFYTGAWAGLSPTRAVYDVAHEEAPWGWKVSAYLWTKAIASGAFLVAALAPWLEVSGNLATVAAPLIGLLFLALTGVLLVVDLKKPARFWTILTRPNWDSWLARGAFIITAFGALATAWSSVLVLSYFGWTSATVALQWIRWPLVAAAFATSGYSGHLFAQCKGRDFWQSPLMPMHLTVQASAAGAAAMMVMLSHSADHSHRLAYVLAAALLLHLGLIAFGEVTVAHATRDGALAVHAMVRGRHARPFWASVILVVVAVACSIWGDPVGPAAVLGGASALAGIAFYKHAWNLSGQAPPLS
jgi:formate-dependent nitrite reductase membrane component NrfD